MFGGQSAFGSNTSSGFGSTPAFGAAPNTSVFGGNNAFGAQQQKPPAFGGTSFGGGGGGLFGATTASSGGLFGSTNTATPSFGAGAGTSAFGSTATAFGGGSSFKPTTGFGGAAPAAGGGLFGSNTQTSQSGGLFGSSQPSTSFGATGTGFGAQPTSFGFGGQQSNQQGTGHAKFAATTGSDTMMKSGVQQTIQTRIQCIVTQKEYEGKSMEELRCEDYMAGRKGVAGAAPSAGGMFGSTQPAAGGLFGSQPAASTAGGMFGQQQKPLFGTSGTGFGAPAVSAAPAFGAGGFGATSQAGGMFGSTAPAFGAPATSTTGFGGFGAAQPAQTGGLFGQAAKPFGSVAPQPQTGGGLFGAQPAATGAFGAPAAGTGFGGGFGQQQAQPTQQIGLFGQQNQAKPAFGGFGAQPASSAPAFGGFGTTTTTQAGGLFGGAAAQKPAFGGFGAAAAPATGFGGFGAASSSGGLFGAQAKPAFSFGGTSTANTGFGGLGAAPAGGSLFSSAAKPGGMFGATTAGFGGTTGFGGGTSGFGTANTGFGGGGLNFGAAAPAQNAAAAPATANSAVQQQLLMALQSSPFAENPLFKPVSDMSGKRSDVIKAGNTTSGPTGQWLSAPQYKVSPHRNFKVRAKAVDSSATSSMFDGLDDDLPAAGEMFVPRTSVKKLVLRPKKTVDISSNSLLASLGDDPSQEHSLTVPLDESRLSVKKVEIPARIDPDLSTHVDESFAALNTRKKVAEDREVELEELDISHNISAESNPDDKDEDGLAAAHPGGIILKRSGYYTIPPLKDIQVDMDGSCVVDGFTIGREGYGNIHYPGQTNIAGLNLDEIVFFRNKEVIVYPDDGNKPALGDGLNKKAQITLDKVWPEDKANSSVIRSPDRLRSMSYEDKLIRASNRLGARFIEYRPETGSWVFKVDHFSKYGLDSSDEDEEEGAGEVESSKRMKTLHLEKRRTTLEQQTEKRRLEILDNQRSVEVTEADGGVVEEGAAKDVEMNDISASLLHQKTLLRSALFSSGMDDGEMMDCPPAKPIILQQRNNTSLLEARPRLIEEIATSILCPNKGLGGGYLMGDTSMSSSLLKSHYTSHTNSINISHSNSMQQQSRSQQQPPPFNSNNRNKRLPSYTLTAGYEKFTHLQNSFIQEGPEVVTPQYVDTDAPLERSYLNQRFKQFADAGLFHNKRFRVGFSNGWEPVCSPGSGYITLNALEDNTINDNQIGSLKSWLQVALDTSECVVDDNGPCYTPVQSVDTLHSHFLEAHKQLQECAPEGERSELWETKHTWDLMLSLWGKLEELEEGMAEGMEHHASTMARRDQFSRWLERGVEESSRAQVLAARERGSTVGKVVGLVAGGDVEAACDALQATGDHRSALLMAQLGGGGVPSRLVDQQLERWAEVGADRFIAPERIRLLSLVAGRPVQQGTNETVNTCAELDWERSLAAHLWYLNHPVASISDTLASFEAAWQGPQAYSARPEPAYSERTNGNWEEEGEGGTQPLDLKYHLIKLYSDRSHRLESVLAPTTHTADQLDYRTSWLVARVAASLGYKMSSPSNSDRLCSDFAGQLEHLGLWDWAVFVLLHIQAPSVRESSVMSVLERHVSLEDEEGREGWLLDNLGVPEVWMAKARAILARTRGKHTILAQQLIKAGDFNEAHKVIIAEIAPSAILSQNYQQLEAFLRCIAQTSTAEKIRGWESEGNIYLQFLDVDTAITNLRQNRDVQNLGYELERLKPVVNGLVRSVSNLPVHSSIQRLAQSEIAKKTANYLRAVYSFESSSGVPAATTARQLAESLSNLPLPEDYALQELRTLTRSYLAEIMDL